MKLPLAIQKDFVVLNPDKRAFVEKNDENLYERLDKEYNDFKGHDLISCHEFSSDWPTWEIHPHGDEIVILLEGSTVFWLRLASGTEEVELKEQGEYVIVPKGTWHTAKTAKYSKLLFITPGQDTKNIGVSELE